MKKKIVASIMIALYIILNVGMTSAWLSLSKHDSLTENQIDIVQNVAERISDILINEKKCDLINSGIYVFDEAMLYNNLQYLQNDNAQQEYYLTSMVEIIKNNEKTIVCVQELSQNNQHEIMGVNTTEQLTQLNSFL